MEYTNNTYKEHGNVGQFDTDDRLEKLNAICNPLQKLSAVIDFEFFRETLENGLYKNRITKAGAKPYDYVLMFKILIVK